MTTWRMRIACWITCYRRILRICNTYCFSIVTAVARTCYVTRTLPVLLLLDLTITTEVFIGAMRENFYGDLS
jgi:hypothetical protein